MNIAFNWSMDLFVSLDWGSEDPVVMSSRGCFPNRSIRVIRRWVYHHKPMRLLGAPWTVTNSEIHKLIIARMACLWRLHLYRPGALKSPRMGPAGC